MKAAVVVFPGSNCDRDLAVALEKAGADVTMVWHKDTSLPTGLDFVGVPGGFSFGDYLRCGAIAARSPICRSVVDFANGGGYVFGVCNGFQILCETGLLPGALLHNESRKFICKNVHLKPVSRVAPLSSSSETDQPLVIPIAHGEGNYFIHEDGLKALHDNDQVLFQYCDEAGKVNNWSNPNGATDCIAGVANKEMNVFGMMPHPERASSSDLGNTDGAAILRGLASLVEA